MSEELTERLLRECHRAEKYRQQTITMQVTDVRALLVALADARREGATEAWDEGFERGAQEQGGGQGLALVDNPYRAALRGDA